MSLFDLPLAPYHSRQVSQGVVYGFVVREEPRDIGIDHDHIGSFGVPLGVLASVAAREIVLLEHLWIIL